MRDPGVPLLGLPAEGERLFEDRLGFGEPAGQKRPLGAALSDHPPLRRLAKLVGGADHRIEVGRGAVDVAELDLEVMAMLVALEHTLGVPRVHADTYELRCPAD